MIPTITPDKDAPRTLHRLDLHIRHILELLTGLAGVFPFKNLPPRTRISLRELKETINGYVPD